MSLSFQFILKKKKTSYLKKIIIFEPKNFIIKINKLVSS